MSFYGYTPGYMPRPIYFGPQVPAAGYEGLPPKYPEEYRLISPANARVTVPSVPWNAAFSIPTPTYAQLNNDSPFYMPIYSANKNWVPAPIYAKPGLATGNEDQPIYSPPQKSGNDTQACCPNTSSATYSYYEGQEEYEDDDKFEVSIEMKHFTLNDITVNLRDGYLNITARHNERHFAGKSGSVSKNITWRYLLPEECLFPDVTSYFSKEKVLTVTAPKVSNTKNRNVPIETGPAENYIENNKETSNVVVPKSGPPVFLMGPRLIQFVPEVAPAEATAAQAAPDVAATPEATPTVAATPEAGKEAGKWAGKEAGKRAGKGAGSADGVRVHFAT